MYNTMTTIFTILGIVCFMIGGSFIVISYFCSICKKIGELKYKYECKHRFDKPPIARCYCIDCTYYSIWFYLFKQYSKMNKTSSLFTISLLIINYEFWFLKSNDDIRRNRFRNKYITSNCHIISNNCFSSKNWCIRINRDMISNCWMSFRIFKFVSFRKR